jgi:GDPmannose 4,6-dehydratase
MDRSAMIFGISGQDGLLLAELLLKKNYRLIGFGRPTSISSNPQLAKLHGRIQFCYGDLTNSDSIKVAVENHPVAEIYNLAAQSRPGMSWALAIETGEINALGAHRLFEIVRRLRPETRIYQASSSDMFGDVLQSPQNEKTPFNPTNPYAIAKTYAHQMARVYRETYGSYISSGILFNHESRYRELRYLSQKVTYGAACVKLGITDSPDKNEEGEPIVRRAQLSLGNLDVVRDWGFAGDYVEAMWLMLQQPKADDFVIGTGAKRTVRELCKIAYEIVGADWQKYVITDPRFLRPLETGTTVADATKARDILGWSPSTSFKDMLSDMIGAHVERLQKKKSNFGNS